MDYEKKYQEDLEAAKGWLKIAKENDNKIAIQILENLFTELRESEDEMIRKDIIKMVTNTCKGEWFINSSKEECLSWLEKQGKHSSAWSEEDKLMIQDAIHWIQEFQKSDRCKDENDMQNSVTCENWLKNILALCQDLK